MKFLQQEQSPDPTGTLKLIPESSDDLWLLSNLISINDYVTTITSRKVQLSSGKSNSTRVKFPLELKVASSDLSTSSLRISGRTHNVNEYVKIGSFHTLELELNKEFSLVKKVWDADSMEKLNEFRSGNGKIKKGSAVKGFVKNDDVAVKAMDRFREVLRGDSDRACYGLKSVESAIEMSAIETLLITDELYRCKEKDMRKKYTGFVESVKRDGGKAMVISCDELAKLTGIGAILRFPLPDLDDLVL